MKNIKAGIKNVSMRFYRRQSVVLACCTFLALLAIIDGVTGREIHLSFLYIVPIAMAAWFSGRRTAVIVSILSAIVWFIVDITAEITMAHPLVHLWNIALRTFFFIAITYGITALSLAIGRQNEMMEFIVHDLKVPLTNSSAALENIMSFSDVDGKIRNFANIAMISNKRALTLIHSIVDLTKLEVKKFVPKIESVPETDIVNTALEQVVMWAEKNGVKISIQAESAHKIIKTDFWLVVRILTNLLGNAIKASPPGSEIRLSFSDAGNCVVFSVCDEGDGISKEWLPRIFDKFHQVEARRCGVQMGNGLGLTFCDLAVKALGGRIWLSSELGKGTTASFELPVR